MIEIYNVVSLVRDTVGKRGSREYYESYKITNIVASFIGRMPFLPKSGIENDLMWLK